MPERVSNFIKIDRNNNLGVIFIEIKENTNPNFMITPKKILIAPWMIGYLLKIMMITGVLSPKVVLNAIDEYYDYKKEVRNGKA